MKVVLLPGLDGTGELFEPLIEMLPKSIKVQTISYDLNKKQSYSELIKYVILNLPQENFILLAESFSGPIAYQVALSKPKQLKSLIVVATFLENPRPFLLKFLPTRVLDLTIPILLIKLFFLGFSTKIEIINLFKIAIKKVPPSVIAFRLDEITKLKLAQKKLDIKTTYIQASNDKLVPSKSLKNWQNICSEISVFKVSGEHFILQSNPVKCAEIVRNEVNLMTSMK